MSTPLVIGPDQERMLANLKRRAEEGAPIDAAKAVADDPEAVRARNHAMTIYLPMAFAVTLTRETQPNGLYWHFSASVAKPGRTPSIPAVEMLLEALKLRPLSDSAVWLEDFGDRQKAVNVLQPVALQ